MYEFCPVTPRIRKLREKIRDRVIPVDSERALLITDSFRRNETVIPIIKRAQATYDILSNLTLNVDDLEMFVGSLGKDFCGCGIYPEWTGESWIPGYIESGTYSLGEDGLYHTPIDDVGPLTVNPEVYSDMVSIKDFWKDRVADAPLKAWKPAGFDDFSQLKMSSYTPEKDFMGSPVGHLTPGHEKIINVGYGEIRRQAQEWLDAHVGNLMGGDIDKYMFYSAVTIVCDAATGYIKRYGKLCFEKAEQCMDESRKAELLMMADELMWISENPARTFREACQAAILYHLVLQLESGYPALAFGRFDQYTRRFFEADVKAGRISLEQAQEIVDAVFLKLHSLYRIWPPVVTASTGVNTYYHTTLGGVDRESGLDATNPVTYMALESMGRLRLHDPTISLRIHKDTPEKLWECALETSKLVGGLPLFQNDEIIIPALMKEVGFDLKDARDYSLIGCQEIVGSGNDFPVPNGYNPPHCSIHYGTILAMAINNGVNPFNDRQCEVKSGYLYEMEDIESVKAAVEKLCRYAIKWQVSMNNYTEYVAKTTLAHPLLSISVEGCMESGTDIIQGGAKYNSFGGTATGLATMADSLSAIKYMCFDKKLCTTREMFDAVMANWEGHEPLREQILREAPHYGNGDPEADEMMSWICALYYDICQECYSLRAKVYKSGLYGATDHVNQGYTTWATPDGRHLGEPLADAASPAQGRDVSGPTAVFRSACCFDHSKYMDGIALNMRIHPSAVSNEQGLKKLGNMTKTYFELGGMETQYNIVGTDTLRAAQEDPETFRDLVVRIAGFSAYFIELPTDMQEDIIRRNENRI